MAEAPDPKMFGSWEDAFQFPVATVRGMERQLRNDIDSNRERLRSLVGESYRDLLGTAESIIEMDGQMQDVELYLGDMGVKCNTRLLDRKTSSLKRWKTAVGATDTERYEFASQLAVLRSCPETISRLLKESSSILSAAKVLVVSRLLHTKLSQRSKPPPYLESLRHRLATLRRRLLARVDKLIKSLDLDRDALVEAMCAFSLATSSSATDVLRHFHHTRLEAMGERIREESDNQEDLLRAMRLYIKTLRDTRTIFPTLLAQALESLKTMPLFKTQDLYALVELNLDLHERWIGDDIRTFTPYIRVDDLQKSESESLLRQWARRALSALLNNLRKDLGMAADTLEVMEIRKHTFELWFSSQHHCTGIEPSEVIDGLRNEFNRRWLSLIQMQAASLDNVGSLIQSTLQVWSGGASETSRFLWDSSLLSMDISNGGKSLREALIARSKGTNESLQAVSDGYTEWAHSVEAIEATIAKVQAIRWEDDMADIDIDEDDFNEKQTLLSEDDPRLLKEECSIAVQKALSALEALLTASAEGPHELEDGQKAAFLLRCWRDIRQRLPKSYQNHNLGLESITRFQKVVAKTALRRPLRRGEKSIAKATRRTKIPGQPLWEGEPPVPVLPSPWVFRLLREVMSSMAEIGSDIWSAHLTDTLKEELRLSVAASIGGAYSKLPQPNGDAANFDEKAGQSSRGEDILQQGEAHNGASSLAEETEPRRSSSSTQNLTNGEAHRPAVKAMSSACRIQQVFDLLFLSQATKAKHPNHSEDALFAVLSRLETDVDLPAKSIDTMKNGAEDYWKRTNLLFALLA